MPISSEGGRHQQAASQSSLLIHQQVCEFLELSQSLVDEPILLAEGLSELFSVDNPMAADQKVQQAFQASLYSAVARLRGRRARRDGALKGDCPYSEPDSHVSPATALRRHYWNLGWEQEHALQDRISRSMDRLQWGVVETAHFRRCLNDLIDLAPDVQSAFQMTLSNIVRKPYSFQFCWEPTKLRMCDTLPWPRVPATCVYFTVAEHDIILASICRKTAPQGFAL